jgi:hypothetical protein
MGKWAKPIGCKPKATVHLKALNKRTKNQKLTCSIETGNLSLSKSYLCPVCKHNKNNINKMKETFILLSGYIEV